MTNWISKDVLITHDVGLHARPAVVVMRLARLFSSNVQISKHADGPWIDAKSIVNVMSLKARGGTLLYVRASGSDAEDAISALCALVERDFGNYADARRKIV